MAKKRTPTQKNIANVNSFIRAVADVYGKGSQQYEDLTNAIADFDIYENKNGVLQIANTKANRKHHSKIRALRNKTKKARSGQRWRKARAESRRDPVAFRQKHEITKDFLDFLNEVYMLIENLKSVGENAASDELYDRRFIVAGKMSSGDWSEYHYYERIFLDAKKQAEYLREQEIEIYGDELTNPDFFD